MYGKNLYGSCKYGAENHDDNNVEIYKTNLIAYLPPKLQEIREFKVINSIIDDEFALLKFYIKELLDQCFIDTATWGLEELEKRYKIKTDLAKSYEERREIIKAKRIGYGTISKKLIREVAQAFSGGEVEIVENPDNYSFIVRFIGVKGIPRNLGSFKDMLDSVKPAHLSYEFKFTYTIWDFLLSKKLKWEADKNKTWESLRVYE